MKATSPDKETIEKVILSEFSMYYVSIGKGNDLYILYCSPIYEDKFVELEMNNPKEVLIGKSPENDISYKLVLMEKIHASLIFSERKLDN